MRFASNIAPSVDKYLLIINQYEEQRHHVQVLEVVMKNAVNTNNTNTYFGAPKKVMHTARTLFYAPHPFPDSPDLRIFVKTQHLRRSVR